MRKYQYEPVSRDMSIRVLRILAGSIGGEIVCELRPTKLGSLPYLALSYVWGNYEEPTTLPKIIIEETIGNDTLHRDLAVRRNLYAALEQLRHPLKDVDCWADAVCIDFDNGEERETQLALMREIYQGADRVMFWLGIQEDYTVDAFKCINILSRVGWEKSLGAESYQQLCCFQQLLANVWFSRRWIIQEVAFARSAVLFSGPCSIYWSIFTEAASVYFRSRDRFESLYSSHVEKRHSTQAAQILISVTNSISPQYSMEPWDALHALEKKSSDERASSVVEYSQAKLRHVTDLSQQERILIKECEVQRKIVFSRTLEELIYDLYPHEVSDYRDTIYAVLSLAKDTNRSSNKAKLLAGLNSSVENYHNIQPDYSKDVFEVFKDFTKYCTQRPSKFPLDIICRPWVPKSIQRMFPGSKPTENSTTEPHPLEALGMNEMKWIYTRKLASWMPTTERLAFDYTQSPERRNADSLVGTPDHPIYRASECSAVDINFGELMQYLPRSRQDSGYQELGETDGVPRGLSDGTLFAKGIQLDIIDILGSHYEGIISEEWLLLGGWNEKGSRWRCQPPVPDALWRTLVADRDSSESTSKKPDFKEAFKGAIGHRNRDDNSVFTDLVIAQGDRMISKFLSRVNDVAWNRRLIRTKKLKRLGLVPLDAERGDILCVLYGCSVPVVLRVITDAKEDAAKEYRLIGECYIDGMMDGEAVSEPRLRQARKNGNERSFVLR